MNLYDLRIQTGLSPEELGREAGVSPDTIRNLEKPGARPHTKTAHALTSFFSRKLGRIVPASELFPREDNVVALPSPSPSDPKEAA